MRLLTSYIILMNCVFATTSNWMVFTVVMKLQNIWSMVGIFLIWTKQVATEPIGVADTLEKTTSILTRLVFLHQRNWKKDLVHIHTMPRRYKIWIPTVAGGSVCIASNIVKTEEMVHVHSISFYRFSVINTVQTKKHWNEHFWTKFNRLCDPIPHPKPFRQNIPQTSRHQYSVASCWEM